MARFILIRHGETIWNRESRYHGQSDIPLNEEGKKQAKKLSERLKDEKIDIVYSSDLQRAFETAKLIAKPHLLDVNTVKEMRELSLGIWEGFTLEEIQQKWPREYAQWRENPHYVRPPGGETICELCNRVAVFLRKIAHNNKEKNVAIVTHAGPIRALLSVILGLEKEKFWKFKISNTSLTVLEYDGTTDLGLSDAFIVAVNDINHLVRGYLKSEKA
jgi:alpha-ribazole phosphatase